MIRRFLEKNKSIIRSEVSKAPFSSLWSWSDTDYISPYYTHSNEESTVTKESVDRKEKLSQNDKNPKSRIQFRFNPEKGCFEEIEL